MSEESSSTTEKPDEQPSVTVEEHIIIRDKDTGDVILNQRG